VFEVKVIVPMFETPGLTTNVPLADKVADSPLGDTEAEKFMKPVTPNG
jgi:hypothetical protein